MSTQKPKKPLLQNLRFYILATSVLVSCMVFAWLRTSIASEQLFYIRTQQVFGLFGIALWYGALIISPIGYVVGKQRIVHLIYARRAIGVSAAYFALLHGCVALWGQLGGVQQLLLLPTFFKWSLLAGAIAFVVLLLMAATSFDVVIRRMTFRRWKWLHRLGYIGGVLAVIHIWSIGTHVAYSSTQIIALAALILLSGLETYRVVTLLAQKYPEFRSKDYFITLFVAIWLFWIVAIVAIPSTIRNYHSRHTDHPQNTSKEVSL